MDHTKGGDHSASCESPVQRKLASHGTVIIGSNFRVGDNVVTIGPIRIGNGVVIGANSVVTRNVPDDVMIADMQAKVLIIFNRIMVDGK
jgi:acetyltransferase-like isoleucine patch superfamily enzyme